MKKLIYGSALMLAAIVTGVSSAQASGSATHADGNYLSAPRGGGGKGGGRGGQDRGGHDRGDRGGDHGGRGGDHGGRGGRGGRGGGFPIPIPVPRGGVDVCVAQNDWGRRFEEEGRSRGDARDHALNVCENRSRGSRCEIVNCYVR